MLSKLKAMAKEWLVENHIDVLLKAWSSRLMAIGGVFEILLDFTDYLDFLPRWVILIIIGLALLARIVKQENLTEKTQ